MPSPLNPQRKKKRISSEKELLSLLSTAIDKKRANRKRKDPDMLREAVLESVVQKLNDEITERSMSKMKKRKLEETYNWRERLEGKGWSTTSFQEEDILGIDDFFRELNSCKTT